MTDEDELWGEEEHERDMWQPPDPPRPIPPITPFPVSAIQPPLDVSQRLAQFRDTLDACTERSTGEVDET